MSNAVRNIIKHSYIKAGLRAPQRALAHARYIQFCSRPDVETGQNRFFSAHADIVSGRTVQCAIKQGPGAGVPIHKLILAPDSNDIDIHEYTREIMGQIGHLKHLDLEWYACEHTNTANAHAHVIVMGVDRNGKRVRFDRDDYKIMRDVGNRFIKAHERYYRELEQDLERAVSDARAR